jgi:hypothetical protein
LQYKRARSLSARTMLVTPSSSVRTVMPATPAANHKKVRRREHAGRNNKIAFHQCSHSDMTAPLMLLLRPQDSIYMLYQ